MPIIECNRPSKLLIYTIIFLLSLILESYSMESIPNNGLFSSVVIAMFFNLCGILAIIPERIVNSCTTVVRNDVVTKNYERNEELIARTSKAVPYDLSKIKGFWLLKNKKNFVIFLYLLVSLIDITTTIAFIYSNSLRTINSILSFSTEGLQIFISCLCCKIILKYKFELHKKVSLYIILIAMIINVCVSFLAELSETKENTNNDNNEDNHSEIIKRLIMTAYMVSFTAFQEVLEKYMMNNCFQNNFYILFVESLLGEIYAAIILLIVYSSGYATSLTTKISYNEENEEIKEEWSNLKFVGRGLLFSLGCIPYSNMRLILGRDFNPTDRIVADKVGNFYFFLRHPNKEVVASITYFIISIVGFMTIIFGSIIYNETVVLKFCNLDRDTTKEIETRKWREHELLMNDMNDLSQYNVTISEMENDLIENNNSIDKEL